ncbi:pyrroloquinoline quinone biosynthesis peptide chaperone PqqD [Streptomyces sp. NPDC006207]|nr:pyrroloquinoline quinone biosynthesis peptide chaperone PqqD [Streptomyces sp. PA03-5A]
MDPTPPGATRSRTRTGPGVEVCGPDRPRLARHVRLTFCRTRQRQVLLHPETVVVLNGSGAAILQLCDGQHTVAEIVTELGARYQTVPEDEVRRFLTRLVTRRWMELTDG